MGSPEQAHDTGPQLPAAATLAPGTVLARRYRILAFLGRGGMGEVYEAEDLDLGGRVALKTLRPELSFPEHVSRFKREIQLARQVTHPHVARTFDVGYHERGAGLPPLTFLTMELLAGETLAQRLGRGRMGAAEALPIARAIAAGLAAAHTVGIVHRDLKPGNVMLVPGSSEERVVVTDFGLARSPSGEESADSGILGSPAYMAPEQVTQGLVTPATDVYSFGVVLHEMVTGARPFAEGGDLPLVLAVRRVGRRPPSPRTLVPDLDPLLERVIAACLEPEPADRPRDASVVLAALGGSATALPAPRRSRRTLAIAVIAVVLAAAGAVSYLARRGAPTVAAPRSGVAVLGFRNLSGRPESAWLSTALVEMLTSELSAGERLRLVPAETVARVKMEVPLPDEPTLSQATLGRLQGNLDADVVVSGSYLVVPGGTLRLDVRAQRVSGETLPAVVETGTEADLPALVARAGAALRARLGEPGDGVPAARAAALPSRADAARLYAEGLDALRRADALTARDRFERAVALEPDHPLPHAALSEAFSALGDDAQASAAARRALAGASRLSDEQRLAVEGRAAAAERDWEKAADAYRLLWRLRPDTLEYGLYVAQTLTAGGRPRDALEVVAEMRRRGRDDARVDLAEAAAVQTLADYKRLKTVAATATGKGRALHAQLLVARALSYQVAAAANMGDWPLAEAAYREMRGIYEAAGHRPGVAQSLQQIGSVLDQKGDRAAARVHYNDALAIRREIGDRGGIARVFNSLCWLEQQEGNAAQAAAFGADAVALGRELNDRAFTAMALNNLALAQRSLDDHAASRASLEEAIVLARQIGEKSTLTRALNNLANVALGEGDLEGAAQRYAEAVAVAREADTKYPLAYGLSGISTVRRLQGRLAEAETLQREAITLRKGTTAEHHAKLSLATLMLDQGRVADAAALAEEVEGVFATDRPDYDGAHTAVHLASVRVAQGRLDEAAKLLALSPKAREAMLRFPEGRFELLTSRLELAVARRRPDPALQREASEAVARGYAERLPTKAAEAEMQLGRLELASGRVEEGRARLAKVEQQATAAGMGLVAAGARAALHR